MESQVQDLSKRLEALSQNAKAKKRRCIIGLAGIPGCGKTTLAKELVAALNKGKQQHEAILIGMDGWHYSRAELDEFDDPAEAHRRRGAPFTFNGQAFVTFLTNLRKANINDSVAAPSFAHETKDPVPDSIIIEPRHTLVLIEGIYLPLDEEPWSAGHGCFDQIWLLVCDRERARSRLIERHVLTGVTNTKEEAANRADTSDLLNGDYMLANMTKPDMKVTSIEDQVLGHREEPFTRLK